MMIATLDILGLIEKSQRYMWKGAKQILWKYRETAAKMAVKLDTLVKINLVTFLSELSL